MFEFVKNTAWMSMAARCGLTLEDCKAVVPNAYDRIMSGKSNLSDFSPNVKDAIEFYGENLSVLNV